MAEDFSGKEQAADDLNDFFKKTASGEIKVDFRDMLREYQSFSAVIPSEIVRSTSDKSEKMLVRAAAFNNLVIALEEMLFQSGSELNDDQWTGVIEFTQKYKSRGGASETQVLTTPEEMSDALDVLELLGIDMKKQRQELADSVQRIIEERQKNAGDPPEVTPN